MDRKERSFVGSLAGQDAQTPEEGTHVSQRPPAPRRSPRWLWPHQDEAEGCGNQTPVFPVPGAPAQARTLGARASVLVTEHTGMEGTA